MTIARASSPTRSSTPDRRGLSAGTQIPVAQLNPFAAYVLAGLPPTNGPGRSNNDEALLLVKDYGDKFDAKLDGQINDKMTAFLRFSQRKDLQYYQPDLSGPSGGDANGYIHVVDQNASAGYTWTVTPTLCSRLAWASPICWAARCRHIWAAPACPPCSVAFKVCRLHLVSLAESTRRPSVDSLPRPPNQQSAVPEPYFLGSGAQLFQDRGPAFYQGGLPIPADPHRNSGH